jgi:hypothetical protein
VIARVSMRMPRVRARQVRRIADRFHLLKNLRETIERQLGRLEAPIRESPLHSSPSLRKLSHRPLPTMT